MTKSMVCYISIALITTTLAQLEHLNSDELPNWTYIGWLRFSGYILLAGFTTYKSYVARPPMLNGEPIKPVVVEQKDPVK